MSPNDVASKRKKGEKPDKVFLDPDDQMDGELFQAWWIQVAAPRDVLHDPGVQLDRQCRNPQR